MWAPLRRQRLFFSIRGGAVQQRLHEKQRSQVNSGWLSSSLKRGGRAKCPRRRCNVPSNVLIENLFRESFPISMANAFPWSTMFNRVMGFAPAPR